MEEEMDKTTLLARMRASQAELEELLAPVPQAWLTEPGVSGAWSIKDVLAHLCSWQERALEHFNAAARGIEPSVPMVGAQGEVDDLNARFYARNRSRSLDDVMSGFRETYTLLLVAVQEASEEDLGDPGRLAWLEGRPLREVVAVNTFEHFDEHSGALRSWLAAHGQGQRQEPS
jgi:hypothetical protein